MNLTRNLYLLFLCGMCTPAVHAAGNMTTDVAVQQTVNQDADATKLKELAEFRKKYKFPEPKASESELKECRNTVNQPKAIWIYIWIICLHTIFSFVCLSWYIATIVMYERFLLI